VKKKGLGGAGEADIPIKKLKLNISKTTGVVDI
jgi:hypothetical protein